MALDLSKREARPEIVAMDLSKKDLSKEEAQIMALDQSKKKAKVMALDQANRSWSPTEDPLFLKSPSSISNTKTLYLKFVP